MHRELVRGHPQLQRGTILDTFHERQQKLQHSGVLEMRRLGIRLRVVDVATHRRTVTYGHLHVEEREAGQSELPAYTTNLRCKARIRRERSRARFRIRIACCSGRA